jgi:hypothetical protein
MVPGHHGKRSRSYRLREISSAVQGIVANPVAHPSPGQQAGREACAGKPPPSHGAAGRSRRWTEDPSQRLAVPGQRRRVCNRSSVGRVAGGTGLLDLFTQGVGPLGWREEAGLLQGDGQSQCLGLPRFCEPGIVRPRGSRPVQDSSPTCQRRPCLGGNVRHPRDPC